MLKLTIGVHSCHILPPFTKFLHLAFSDPNPTCFWWPPESQHQDGTNLMNTLVTSCEELTHWKRPWRWEGLGAGGEGDDRGWDGRMASPTRWAWVWVNSGSWWWTGRPGVLRFMGLQRVWHDWATELNWTDVPSQTRGYLSLSDCFPLPILT